MSAIRMECGFELDRGTFSTMPVIANDLSGARIRRQRSSWTLHLKLPSDEGASLREEDGDGNKSFGIRTFTIELMAEADPGTFDESAAFDDVLSLASDAADALWVLQPTRGFAGVVPRLASFSLTCDEERLPFRTAQSYFPNPIWIGEPIATREDLELAVRDGIRPSVARVLVAQATRWGMGDRYASKSAALMLAASACEVAIKSAVSAASNETLGTLSNVLVPDGRQAPLSPAALLEHVVPLVVGSKITDDHPDIIKRYKALTRLRDQITHTGVQASRRDPSTDVHLHIRTARIIVRWLEDNRPAEG